MIDKSWADKRVDGIRWVGKMGRQARQANKTARSTWFGTELRFGTSEGSIGVREEPGEWLKAQGSLKFDMRFEGWVIGSRVWILGLGPRYGNARDCPNKPQA